MSEFEGVIDAKAYIRKAGTRSEFVPGFFGFAQAKQAAKPTAGFQGGIIP